MPNQIPKRVRINEEVSGDLDEFLGATWDLRFEAFSFSPTLFVDAEGETQLVFSFRKPKSVSAAEMSLVKSVISAGGGVFLDSVHDAEERRKKIDVDWANHREVHLISTDGHGTNPLLILRGRCFRPF